MRRSLGAVLALQHLLAMFGATVLVPFLTGMDPSLALLTAGLGTLTFHLITKGQVPVFLGSSFVFLGAISTTFESHGLATLKGGIISAGLAYAFLSLGVKVFGAPRIQKLLPLVVVGPLIISVGLRLVPTAVGMTGLSEGLWDPRSALVAGVVVVIVFVFSVVERSFFRMMPILFGILGGYLVALALGMVDFTAIEKAHWIGLSDRSWEDLTTAPVFEVGVSFSFALLALVCFMEHIGDITINGVIVGKDFIKSPGLHRTLLGDGVATALAGLLGGPANTTYGENTGVLAITKVYNPVILRVAAIYAIALAFMGKFGGFLASIPDPVMGGVSLILFGLIAISGVRVLVNSQLDFSHSRNLLVASLVLSLGIGVNEFLIGPLSFSGLSLAALVGITLNWGLPVQKEEE